MICQRHTDWVTFGTKYGHFSFADRSVFFTLHLYWNVVRFYACFLSNKRSSVAKLWNKTSTSDFAYKILPNGFANSHKTFIQSISFWERLRFVFPEFHPKQKNKWRYPRYDNVKKEQVDQFLARLHWIPRNFLCARRIQMSSANFCCVCQILEEIS